MSTRFSVIHPGLFGLRRLEAWGTWDGGTQSYASDAENTICRFFTPVYALPRMETLFWFATATGISHLVLFFKEPVIFSTHFGLERRRGEDKALFLCVICLYMSSHSDPQVLTPSALETGWGGQLAVTKTISRFFPMPHTPSDWISNRRGAPGGRRVR